jgi:hypothetical protein
MINPFRKTNYPSVLAPSDDEIKSILNNLLPKEAMLSPNNIALESSSEESQVTQPGSGPVPPLLKKSIFYWIL